MEFEFEGWRFHIATDGYTTVSGRPASFGQDAPDAVFDGSLAECADRADCRRNGDNQRNRRFFAAAVQALPKGPNEEAFMWTLVEGARALGLMAEPEEDIGQLFRLLCSVIKER